MKLFHFATLILLILSACDQEQMIQEKVSKRIAMECPPYEQGTLAKHLRCNREITLTEDPTTPNIGYIVRLVDGLLPAAELCDARKISKDKYDDFSQRYTVEILTEIQRQNAFSSYRALQYNQAFGNPYHYQQTNPPSQHIVISPTLPPQSPPPSYFCQQSGHTTNCSPY